jgi:hypothetical protein
MWCSVADLLPQAMDIVHPWTLDESGKPLLPITTFSIAMIHRYAMVLRNYDCPFCEHHCHATETHGDMRQHAGYF